MGQLLKWAIIGGAIIMIGLPWLVGAWNSAGIWEKFWLVVILALVAAFFIPGLRSFIMPLVVPFVLTVLACLFLYNTFLKWQQTGYSLLYAAQQVANGGWDSAKNIAKKFFPKLGPGTIAEEAIAKQKADAEYLQCLADAIARLPPAIQAQGAVCMQKPAAEREQCLVNILSDDSREPGTIVDLQVCRQKKEVLGAAAKYIKPILDIFCKPFLPEFMQDWVCIDRWKQQQPNAPPPVRTDQPYVDCIFGIVNDRSSGGIAVDASECMAVYASRQKYVQCVVEKARASPNEWVRRSLPYCEALPK